MILKVRKYHGSWNSCIDRNDVNFNEQKIDYKRKIKKVFWLQITINTVFNFDDPKCFKLTVDSFSFLFLKNKTKQNLFEANIQTITDYHLK